MEISSENKEKIVKWLESKCGVMRCFCCGGQRWELIGHSAIQLGFDLKSTRFHYHAGTPVVSVVCVNCGHLLNFLPGLMGIVPDPPTPAPKPEPSKT